jgi:hypothetical protein
MNVLLSAVIVFTFAAASRAAPRIDLELATERGVQITAPHEWLQLLAAIGIENVRIRGMKPGDEPQVDNRGTEAEPSYHVVGILTARDQLRFPGGTFSRADRARLKDYFERLVADGAESLTAPRGMFDLTEKEIHAVFADLAQPINLETKGQPVQTVIEEIEAKFALKFDLDADVASMLRRAKPVADELKGVAAGTGLAIVFRANGLELRPEKSRGRAVVYRILPAEADSLRNSTIGKTSDQEMRHWPIGWEPQGAPGNAAPTLFEFLNAEIDGYTLAETLTAIGPRVKIPMYLDHAALAAHKIDPAQIQVRIPRTRTIYKRVIDRALSQARLGSQVRIDEAGKPFLWITR